MLFLFHARIKTLCILDVLGQRIIIYDTLRLNKMISSKDVFETISRKSFVTLAEPRIIEI